MAGGTFAVPRELDKLKELILFITWQCKGKPTFASTVLNKLLFYSDFYHYAKFGESITGEIYRKEQHGIVPTHLIEARGELIDEGKLSLEDVEYYEKTQKRPTVSDEPQLVLLTEMEKEFVTKSIIEKYGNMNAREIRDLDHREIVYLYAREGEKIPYSGVYSLGEVKVPADVMVWAIERATHLGFSTA